MHVVHERAGFFVCVMSIGVREVWVDSNDSCQRIKKRITVLTSSFLLPCKVWTIKDKWYCVNNIATENAKFAIYHKILTSENTISENEFKLNNRSKTYFPIKTKQFI